MLTSKPNKSQANAILLRICKDLQKSDIKNGFHKGDPDQGNYMQSYYALEHNPKNPISTYHFTEIIDDAWNCKLITDPEVDYMLRFINQSQ